MLSPRNGGFTMVEVVVALVILAAAVLGLAGTATTLTTSAATAETRAQVLYAVQDRVYEVSADPDYDGLDAYAGTRSDTPLDGFTMTTTVVHVDQSSPPLDYKRIHVVVRGVGLPAPVERSTVVAAP